MSGSHNAPPNQRTQRNQRFQRFHGTPRNPRKQRFQRNHDFTVPQRNHESNGFNEITISRYPPKTTKATISTKSRFHGPPTESRKQRNQRKARNARKKAFRCFRCVCINRDFVGNVGQARPKGAHTQSERRADGARKKRCAIHLMRSKELFQPDARSDLPHLGPGLRPGRCGRVGSPEGLGRGSRNTLPGPLAQRSDRRPAAA